MQIDRIKAEEIRLAYPEHKSGKLVLPNGTISFWKDRELHNEDGPAVIYPDGYGFEYYKKDKLHRHEDSVLDMEQQPAVKLNSRLEYHRWGKLHRVAGPAIHDKDRNIQVWAQRGEKYRYKLPAVIHEPEGYISYWGKDGRHRVDGPARIWTLLGKVEWWVNGSLLSEDELKKVMRVFADPTDFPLIWGHPVLRPVAEFVKDGGRLSNIPVSFKEEEIQSAKH